MLYYIDSSSRGSQKQKPGTRSYQLGHLHQTHHNTCQSTNIEELRHLSSNVKYMLSPTKGGARFHEYFMQGTQLPFLHGKHRLDLIYMYTKYHQNISKGIKVIERTSFFLQTDRRTDEGQADCYIPRTLLAWGIKVGVILIIFYFTTTNELWTTRAIWFCVNIS